jgi:HD-like signal output (HDOD) protein
MIRKLLSRRSSPPRIAHDTIDFTAALGGYEPPSFPVVVAQALELLGDPASDMSAVSALVERDPAASTRVLRLVNSASFSPRSTVTSVHQSAVMLGRNQLEALLISVGAHNALPKSGGHGFDHSRFWVTSARRAVLASLVAERTDPTRRSENFTAALLQDMAVPVLASHDERYGDLLVHWHNSTEDLAALETDNYGWHHGTVASWMGTNWCFPSEFVDFMAGHHGAELVGALLPAQIVSPLREADTAGDEEVIEIGAEVMDLSTDELASLVATATHEATILAQLLQ